MEELLQAPTDGVRDAIVVPPILASQFELKIKLLNLVTAISFHGFENDDSHSHIHMFYNGLSKSDQDSLNSPAQGNLLTRNTQEALTIIENKSKVEALGKHISSMNKPIHFIQDSCDSCGGPHSFYECQAINNMNQKEGYAYSGNEVVGKYRFKPNYNPDNLSYRSTKYLAPPGFSQYKALQERRQGVLPSDTVPNPMGEIKAITIRSGIVLAGPSVPPPPLSCSFKKVGRDLEKIMDQVLPESTTRVPPPVVQLLNKEKLQDKFDIQVHKLLQMFKKLHFNISLAEALALMPNGSLKKVTREPWRPWEFLNPCDFPKLEKCMALADLGASINLMPLFVWKKLMVPELIPTRMTLELANRSVAYPAGITKDVCVQVGKFTFPADFIVVDYDVDPRVPLILGRPFLRTARALVDVYGEELILSDVLKIQKSLHPCSRSTTYPSDSFPSLASFETSDSSLEEFTDELALLEPLPPRNKDDKFDPGADIREIEYLLSQDPSTDSSPKTDIGIIDPILERFTNEPALVYPFPLGDDDNDLSDFKSDNKKWKKLLYGIFILGGTQIFHDESKDKDLKVNSLTKALLVLVENNFLSHSSDCSSDRELLFFLESTVIETLLSLSSKNKDKVFNPGILIYNRVHFINLDLSYQSGTFICINVYLNIVNESPMEIFLSTYFSPNITMVWGESS
nr:hypothetical protein [Tanacetum cinerariifolium]